ncbi:MAG: hypothetical protein ABEK01_00500 [Candidatus Nanohaloarchaea archaeon]
MSYGLITMEPLSVLLSLALAGAGLAAGVLSLKFLEKIRTRPRKAMASFQLNPEESVREFRWILYGLALETSAFLIYGYGAFTGRKILLDVGRFLSLVYAGIGTGVAYRWWRRFFR